ncbi:hypothetical protein BHE97_16285 [Aeromicrobium sp. PE09-221]|uniref:enoyl-CoA hydratase-related protein n=1 Tax=Aeromicrobium sp. PE09-221 TaxID=1898043 RepID=UPI000B69457D|nr:enoyl-CoA hydratase-related protein [Aeromicrobium sp. PE09-221]OUZ07654.1 hypothetical protein BHE97_16285 [Aeromicrobium sp. PE09-221]
MGDDESVVAYEVASGVAWIRLNRPDRGNAWTMRMDDECAACLTRAEADPEVRVIVLTGAGRKFCVGADVELLGTMTDAAAAREALGGRLHPLTDPSSVVKPVVAAINGSAAGLALGLTLLADVRVCVDDARFTTAYSRRGLVAEHGEAYLLQRTVGRGHASELLLSGRVFDAKHALRIGLVSATYPRADFEAAVRAYAEDLAANCSPFSMAAAKRQLSLDMTGDLRGSLDRAEDYIQMSFEQPDLTEGVQSFLERRAPRFPAVNRELWS